MPRLSQNGPQRHHLELLDESVGVSGSGAYQCFALENLAGADADRVLALAAYKDFLTLWKDADPDIPILKRAKAEYSKLQ
jgi:eukaryotic-like serine/threonine-protein kinase